MRVTDTIANFELINNDAQNSAIFSSSGNKNFGNLELLNIQTKKQTPFMNFELNQSILDGSLTNFYQEEQTNIALFKKSRMYTEQGFDNVYQILEEIFLDANFANYQLDESLRNTNLSGYIPVCSHKQAIHQVAFACNCMVYDNRESKIVIEPFDFSSSQEIQSSEIFDSITVKRKETVTGLTVTVHNFKLKSSREEVFKGYLEQGTKEILFNFSCSQIEASSEKIRILEQSVNYVILDVLENGEYTLTGLKYEDLSYKCTKEIFDDFSIKKNNLEIDKATLINPSNVELLSENWISYFRMYNLSIEFKFISNGQKTGQNLTFIDSDGHLFTGALVRQTIDIGRGFLSSCYLLGYQHLQEIEPNPQFSGDDKIENSKVEIYSNEDYGII